MFLINVLKPILNKYGFYSLANKQFLLEHTLLVFATILFSMLCLFYVGTIQQENDPQLSGFKLGFQKCSKSNIWNSQVFHGTALLFESGCPYIQLFLATTALFSKQALTYARILHPKISLLAQREAGIQRSIPWSYLNHTPRKSTMLDELRTWTTANS